MTREQQVRAALKLLELPPARREAGRASIENALDIMTSVGTIHRIVKAARSKAAKKARARYYLALCKLRSAHKTLHTTEGVEPPSFNSVESAIASIENLGEPEQYELYPGAGGRWRQAFAVALAYELLMEWWGSDEFIACTRKGPWWRLSAILYGEDIDLFRHLRAFRPELSPFRRLDPRRA